jgi:hypothetical protein
MRGRTGEREQGRPSVGDASKMLAVRMRGWIVERGQGLLEMVVVLPVLLILLLGVVEMGYAMRNYLVVVNANREGCRFAARGRFSDERVGQRVVSAGGVIRLSETDVPFLRTHGTEPNTAIIVTHIPMDADGQVEAYTSWVTGVVPSAGGGIQIAMADSSRITSTMPQIIARHEASTQEINALREANQYEPMENRIVIVETYFMHHPLWKTPFIPLPDPWLMYAQTEMRVTTDRGE